MKNERSPICILADIILPESGQLGMGIKALEDDCIVVTNYKFSPVATGGNDGHSAAKDAGLRIGDQILVIEDKVVTSIASVVEVMKRITSSAAPSSVAASDHVSTQKHVRMLLLRWLDPRWIPGLEEVAEKDLEFSKSLDKQERDEETLLRDDAMNAQDSPISDTTSTSISSSLSTARVSRPSPMEGQDHMHIPSRLLGFILHMINRAANPFATSEAWISSKSREWPLTMMNCLSRLYDAVVTRSESEGQGQKQWEDAIQDAKDNLLRNLTNAMLELEYELCYYSSGCSADEESAQHIHATNSDKGFVVNNSGVGAPRAPSLLSHWLQDRRRLKWREACKVGIGITIPVLAQYWYGCLLALKYHEHCLAVFDDLTNSIYLLRKQKLLRSFHCVLRH
jgi:hypothetical protein